MNSFKCRGSVATAYPLCNANPTMLHSLKSPTKNPMTDTLAHLPDMDVMREEHAKWLASGGRDGRRAILRKMELADVDLSASQLASASLRGLVLRRVDLSHADLQACDLSETVMEDVNLTGANLSAAQLTDAQWSRVTLDTATLAGAEAIALIAQECSFAGAGMQAINLREAQFARCDFSRAVLTGAALRGASVEDTSFIQADLADAECREASFRRVNFAEANVQGAHFRDAAMQDVNFRTTDISGAVDMPYDPQLQQLEDEKAALAGQRLEVEEGQMLLARDREALASQQTTLALRQARFHSTARYLHGLSLGFGVVATLWCGVAAILLALTFGRLSEIGFGRVAGIVAGVGMVLILSFLSLYFTIKTRSVLLDCLGGEQKQRKKKA